MEYAYFDKDHLLISDGTIVEHGEEISVLHDIHLDALASWSELLGYTNIVDTVEAIHSHSIQADEDEVGTSHWEEPMLVLRRREMAREAAAFEAKRRGARDDPRSPLLQATLAARAAVLELNGSTKESDSVLSKCQRASRAGLNLPDVDAPASAVRGGRTTCEPERNCSSRGRVFSDGDREKLDKLLAPRVKELKERRARFCHSLTGNVEDPLGVERGSVTGPQRIDIDAIRARYQKETP